MRTRVKSIQATSLQALETQINTWLEATDALYIRTVLPSLDSKTGYTALIFYEESPPP